MRKLIYLLPLLLFVCFGCGESDEESDEDLGGVAEVVSTNPLTGGVSTTQGTQGTQNLPPKGKIEVYLDAYEEMTVIHEGLDKAKFVLDQVNVKEYGQLCCKLDEVNRALYEGVDTIEKLNKIKETFSAGQRARLDDLDGRSLKVNLEINEKRRAHFVEDNKRILEFMKGLDSVVTSSP